MNQLKEIMKHFTISFFIFLLASTGHSQDYYWVGDGGNWSDLSHWATTSGGNTFHTELPGPDNDVYFDENSFTLSDQVVDIDLEESYCRNFTAVGVQNGPTINGGGFYDKLYVYGDLEIAPEMNSSLQMIYMMSDSESQIITGGKHLSNFLQLYSGGEYHLNDSISVGNLYVQEGSVLYTNNFPVNTTQRIYCYSGNPTLNLGTSNVYTRLWWAMSGTNLDANNATIYFSVPTTTLGDFHGGGKHYHRVVYSGIVDIMDDNTFDTFEVLPGSDVTLTAESVQTADEFILNGTAVQAISIGSSTVGTQASLSKSSGEVNASYLILQDNNATGGAEFNAEESIDQGNNTGWNISITVPQDYYWVGGAGDWEDASHWATSSGGNTFHDNPPTAVDDVFFDENSGLTEGDIVALGTFNWGCRSFSVQNINEGAVINQPSAGNLNVYGDFVSDSDVIFNLGTINFLSENDVTISVETGSLGNNSALTVNSQGNVQLLTPLTVRNLTFLSGNFLANGNDITVLFQLQFQSTSTAFADLSDLTLHVRLFSNNSPPGQLVVSNTEIFCSGSFNSNNQDYYRVTLEGASGSPTQSVNGSFSAEELVILPGAIVEIQAGNTITTAALTVEGTAGEPIEIISSTDGMEATFFQESGTVNGNYLILKDNHATGGALFLANNSELIDNVEGWNFSTSLSALSREKEMNSFPNPASNEVNVMGHAGETLKIFNLSGQLVRSQMLTDGWNTIHVGSLSPGLYLLQSNSNHAQTRTERLVVQ